MRYIVWIYILVIFNSCNSEAFTVCDEERIINIGKLLTGVDISHKNRASVGDLVFVGDGLIRQLRFIKADDTAFTYKAMEGDIRSPFGDKQGDCVLVISSASHNLKIRLKFNVQKDKYDILGWSDSYE